jgi:integrase/recombinase XerC
MYKEFLNFIKYEKRYSRHTLASYQNDLEQLQHFLAEQYPESEIEEVNHAMLRDWVVALSSKGLSARSINRKLVAVRSFYKFLMRRGYVAKNPAMKLNSLKTRKDLPDFVRQEEMTSLLDHKLFDDSFEGRRDQLVLELLYGTGIRLSELVELTEAQVDRHSACIKVLGKRDKERIVPVSSPLLFAIEDYIRAKNEAFCGNDYHYLIVTNRGRKAYPMLINRIVKKYLAGTAVDKKSPHILRHTYATHLLERGAELNAVKDLLGHQSLAATQVYTHNTLGKLKKVFDQAHPKA